MLDDLGYAKPERGRKTVRTMDETAPPQKTDGLGSVDPSRAIIHVAFFFIGRNKISTIAASEVSASPKATYYCTVKPPHPTFHGFLT